MVLLKSTQRVVVILAVLLASGCAGVQTPPKIIFHDNTHLVRLDLDRSIGGPDDPDRHTHPIDIGMDQVHTIFDSMRVEEHRAFLQRTFMGPAKRMRVLSENDITVLAPQIREAFLQATPQEHVIFALINPVGNRHEVTAGEMFVKENTLHLILNCFQSIDADNGLSSLCGAIRQQGYDLSFTEKEYFVGFGNQFFGHGKKEIIVDYASIPSATIPLTASVADEGSSGIGQLLPLNTELREPEPIHPSTTDTPISPLEPTAPPKIQLLPLEEEDSSSDATEHVTDVDRDHIQMLERKIEALTQTMHNQREALEQRTQLQQSHPPRILFLTSPPMRGDDVTTLQRALGFPPDRIDGIFGKQTDRAVRTFQKQAGTTVDGKVGPNTRNALR